MSGLHRQFGSLAARLGRHAPSPGRLLGALILILLVVLTWGRPTLHHHKHNQAIVFEALALPSPGRLSGLGEFRLENAWWVHSDRALFGSYSSLLTLRNGELAAISDSGLFFQFSPPGFPATEPRTGILQLGARDDKFSRDVESATADPRTGQVWLGLEQTNTIMRLRSDWTPDRLTRPSAMADWGANTGPEAMVRLADGRFVVLSEGFDGPFAGGRHKAVLFRGDPIVYPRGARFVFDGPATFRPTDMAQLPDGRVLVLLRKLIWPQPRRFASRLAIVDPATIRAGQVWHAREVARLGSTLPIDNFEGLAIGKRRDGRIDVWLISDDNFSREQRTLLWRLSVDPARLP